MLIKIILTGHITSQHKVTILLFHGGDLVSLITFKGTILDQVVSCFSGKYLSLTGISKCYVSTVSIL